MALTKVRGDGAEGLTLSSTTLTVANGLTLTDGNVTLASGHGIDFSATANSGGSMSSELLDFYEEGTFTPSLFGASTTGSPSYSSQTGHYIRIGNLCSVGVKLHLTSKGSMSGEIRVSGLPFTASSSSQDHEAGLLRTNTGTSVSETYNVFPLNGTTNAIFRSCNTAADNSIADGEIGDSTTFHFGLMYRTA
jgi:hypothetical protein